MATNEKRADAPDYDDQKDGYSRELSEVLTDLSRLILSEEIIETTMQRVATLASRAIPQAQAGVTLVEKGWPSTAAATSDLVRDLDEKQYETGEGPCLEAIKTHTRVHALDMSAEERWPGFVNRARELGVVAAMGIPLMVGDESEGCLNLYFTTDAFDERDLDNAKMFAQQAAVALHNSMLYEKSVKLAAQLQEALGSRAVIDQAKGVLMERERIGADQAFDLLREASQKLNIKVRDIAQKIVDDSMPT
jgi:GAF domain-containing protein